MLNRFHKMSILKNKDVTPTDPIALTRAVEGEAAISRDT